MPKRLSTPEFIDKAKDKTLLSWDIQAMEFALSKGLIPIVQGDVIFDAKIGGTIFSTETIFQFLSEKLHPKKILLAGLDRGVYTNLSTKSDIIPLVTPTNFEEIRSVLSGAKTADVTGGMLSKVQLMLDLVQSQASLEAQIFSGREPGNIRSALAGKLLGTLVKETDTVSH